MGDCCHVKMLRNFRTSERISKQGRSEVSHKVEASRPVWMPEKRARLMRNQNQYKSERAKRIETAVETFVMRNGGVGT